MQELSAFQRDMLYVIASLDEPYGLGIKTELEEYYEEEVNTGRVYQNLNKMAESGYVEKDTIDKRTNSYTLTSKAGDSIDTREMWQAEQVDQLSR